jgi:gas vesicle protein GvpL/GvpF
MPQSVTARSNRIGRALGHRQVSQRMPGGLVVWVYAITDDLQPGQLAGLTGVAGEPVRAVAEAGLIAVVGSVDARAFGDEARASLLSDLASIERLGRAHHQVIAHVAAECPVLPLRLATVYPDDQTVRALLAEDGAEFAVMLESFRGTEEWGIKVYLGLGKEAADDAVTAPQDAIPALEGGAEACAEVIDRALSGIAVAARRQPTADPRFDGPDQWLVLNAAYLLNSDRAGEFATVARALAMAHEGLRADLTGPWPPYSFAELHQA